MFATYDAPPEVIRGYQKQWVKSVRQLGDKWLVAKQVQRIQWESWQEKTQSKTYRVLTAATAVNLKPTAHAVEKTTS